MSPRRIVIELPDDAMIQILVKKTGAQRLQIATSLFRSTRRMIETNIRARHPDWDNHTVNREIAARIAGGTR